MGGARVRKNTCRPSVMMMMIGRFARVLDTKLPHPHLRAVRYTREIRAEATATFARHCYLQVLGTGRNELAPTLLLSTDKNKYFFNCSETTLRLCEEHKIKVSSIRNVFFTRCSWENTGGILNLANTLSHLGVKELMLHGPVGIHELSRVSKASLGERSLPFKTLIHDLNESIVCNDHCLSVTKIELSPKPKSHSQPACDGSQIPLNHLGQSHHACSHKTFTVAAYVCRMATLPGRFDSLKAKELGIPEGEIRRTLVSGKSILTPDGRTVHSHEVVGPPQVGPEFLVLECPHVDFIPSVVSHPSLQSSSLKPSVIVHMSPTEVVRSDAFQTWMQSFGCDTTHLLVHEDFCPAELVIRSYLKLQLPLHCLLPRVFHLPCIKAPKLLPVLGERTLVANSLMKYHLRPIAIMGKFEYSKLIKPILDDVRENLIQISLNRQLAGELNITDIEKQRNTDSEIMGFDIADPVLPSEPAVTFLGTSSAVSSRYRNGSGILLHSGDGCYMLLDCAEGTLEQIYRCFGSELGDHVIRNLTCVFLSHHHLDHHLGIIRVLNRQSRLLEKPTGGPLLISSTQIIRWLSLYNQRCETIAYRAMDSKWFVSNNDQCTFRELNQFGLTSFYTVPVIHTRSSYGVVLQHKQGWKLVYSGDTRPCCKLVTAGKRATLLIHEATYTSDMKAEAKRWKHSTTEEAIQVASHMDAHFTILTHFSARYRQILLAVPHGENIGIAFDCMTVTLRELNTLPPLLSSVQNVFSLMDVM